MEGNPTIIFLFSGKRKCGKDFIAELLHKKFDSSVIIRLSGPIKSEYAEKHNLDLKELSSSSSYKEKFRKDMITWSECIRAKDYSYFIKSALKMFNAYSYPVWIVSDMRRKSDLNWFKENFSEEIIYPVRISASEETRIERGYAFTSGVDDAESECDLDNFSEWKFTMINDSKNHDSLKQFIDNLSSLIK